MKPQSDSGKKRMIKTTLATMIVFACLLSSCNTTETPKDYITETSTDYTTENWIDSITDENGVYIGQDKEVVGYYKRIGIVKSGETYEDMLELRDTEKQGYLVANDDGTAFFELDGEKTEFVFDDAYFYLSDDTERTNGFRYTCINGRLIIDDGTTITQYLRLTDEELASYLENGKTDTLQYQDQQTKAGETGENNREEENIMTMKIGEIPVQVDWEDNESEEALKSLAKQGDITIQMSMYGGFEQVGALGESLPRNDKQTTTKSGDIVLYSGNQIVVFYGSNSWAYTRLGHIGWCDVCKGWEEVTEI